MPNLRRNSSGFSFVALMLWTQPGVCGVVGIATTAPFFVFTLAMAVIGLARLLWHWLVILLVLGPPTYAGIVAGHFVGVQFDSVGTGLFVAVIVSGCLIETVRYSLRRVR